MLTWVTTFVFLVIVGDFAFGWRENNFPLMATLGAFEETNLLLITRIDDTKKVASFFPATETGVELSHFLAVFNQSDNFAIIETVTNGLFLRPPHIKSRIAGSKVGCDFSI